MFTRDFNTNSELVYSSSTWQKSTDKDFSNGTLKNLTIIGNSKNAELQFDLSNVTGWTKKSPQTSPSPRYFHAMAAIKGTSMILLFGGNTSTSNNNETWLYDSDINIWTQVITPSSPSPRMAHAMASVDTDDKVVLFGGMGNADFGTWIYDLSENTWENKTPTSRPTPRAYHAMATIHGDDKVLLHGGIEGIMTFHKDTWIYDVSEDKWTERVTTNSPDASYLYAMAAVHGTDKVVLFGGGVGTGLPSTQTWIYDESANTWTLKSPSVYPNVRTYHQMATIYGTDKVLLFGGTDWGFYYVDETWVYDFSDNTWTQKMPKNKPKAAYAHALSTIYNKDKVLFFGGNTGSVNNNTWEYKFFLPKMNGTFISKPFDTGIKSQYYDLGLDYNLPANSSIKLQLRSAKTLLELFNESYIGPDGNKNTFYNSSSTPIWFGHNGDRFIQYRVFFSIFNNTILSPSLSEVIISYNCLPVTIVLDPVNGSTLTINKPTFKWTFIDYDSELQEAFQLIIDNDLDFHSIDFDSGIRNTDEQKWEFPLGTSYSELPDGTWYWKVRTKDTDNVWTNFSQPWKLSIDTNQPSSYFIMPKNNQFYSILDNISGEAVDPPNGSGLNKVELSIKCFNTNTYWDGSTWVPFLKWLTTSGTERWVFDSSSVSWSSGKVYNVRCRATDNANLVEVPGGGNSFSIDMSAPISKIDTELNNYWLNNLNEISGSAVDMDGSGVDYVEISIQCKIDYSDSDEGAKENDYWNGNAWDSDESWLLVSGTNQWSFNTSNINWSTGNQYSIQSRAIDKINNCGIPSAKSTFFYDNQKPETTSILINNDIEYTNNVKVNLILNAEDIGSGVSDMSFSEDGSSWSSWEKFNHARCYYLSTEEGNKSIYFRVRDRTGNIADPVMDTIILDSTPPGELLISINEDDKYTNSGNVELDLFGEDFVSGITEMAFSFNGINWLSWEPFQYKKFISLPPGDGNKKIFFKAIDKAGNTAMPVFDSIIVDTEPPHSLSILINDGAAMTNFQLVSLKINAVDNTSGIFEISYCTNGNTWSSWENFSAVKDYLLPFGDGVKSIYFRVKDEAGNIAGPKSATILLNTSSGQIEDQPKEDSTVESKIWYYFLLIIIILILIIVGLAAIYIRNRRVEQKLVFAGILPIKPGEIIGPITTVKQVSTSTQLSQLPGASIPPSTGGGLAQTIPSEKPMLEKSTQITSEHVPKPPSQVPQLPRLPPALSTQDAQNTTQSTQTKEIKPENAQATSTEITSQVPLPSSAETPNTTTINVTSAPTQITETPVATAQSQEEQKIVRKTINGNNNQ